MSRRSEILGSRVQTPGQHLKRRRSEPQPIRSHLASSFARELQFVGPFLSINLIYLLKEIPEIFKIFQTGVLSKGLDDSFFINCFDIRKHAVNKHGQIDSKPYGGGEGMVMMAEPLKKSIEDIPRDNLGKVIYLSPQGQKLNQNKKKVLVLAPAPVLVL